MQTMTKSMAESRIAVLQKQLADIETEMVNLALEHKIELWTDRGRLLLEDDKWSGKYRGEWLSSSDEC